MVRRDETQIAQEVPEQIGLSQPEEQSKEASNPFTQLPNRSLQSYNSNRLCEVPCQRMKESCDKWIYNKL